MSIFKLSDFSPNSVGYYARDLYQLNISQRWIIPECLNCWKSNVGQLGNMYHHNNNINTNSHKKNNNILKKC